MKLPALGKGRLRRRARFAIRRGAYPLGIVPACECGGDQNGNGDAEESLQALDDEQMLWSGDDEDTALGAELYDMGGMAMEGAEGEDTAAFWSPGS